MPADSAASLQTVQTATGNARDINIIQQTVQPKPPGH